MSRILAVANIKGGVGKTTTVVNLSAALAERGFRVLAIDLDPQSSLTLSMGMKPEQVSVTIRQMLGNDPSVLWPIHETEENWAFIPTNVDLRVLEHELETHPHRIPQVAAALNPLREKYDFILLDCPASAGPLIGAALAAADQVVVPLTPDYLSFQVSRSLFRIINAIRQNINPRLRIAGIFLTMYDTRTKHARDLLTTIHETYDDMPFFSAIVRQSVKVKEAPSQGQSVLRYAPDSQAANAYRVIAHEIINGISSPMPPVVTDRKDAGNARRPAPLPSIPIAVYAASGGSTAAPVKEGAPEATLPPIVVINDPILAPVSPPAVQTETPSAPAKASLVPITMLAETDAPKNAPVVTALVSINAPGSVTALGKAAVSGNGTPPAANVPPFLARAGGPTTGAHENGSHNGSNGHADTLSVEEKEYAFQVASLPPLDTPPRESVTNPHKILRALARNVKADVRSALLSNDLEKQVEHLLFISTAEDVTDLLQDASLLVELGMNALGEKMFERITELDPKRSEGWLGWARVTTDPMQRVAHLKKAIYLNPSRELRSELAVARQALQEHAYALLDEGTSQTNPESMAQAHELFKHATTIDPTDERAWLGCARTADNLVEKMSYLEQARKLNPQSKQVQEQYTILGSFVHGEPKERWSLARAKKAPWVLGILVLAIAAAFVFLPMILTPR